MPTLAPTRRARELSDRTQRAWLAAKDAVGHKPGYLIDRWHGRAPWSDLPAEERSDAGLDALDALDAAIAATQAARDALAAELLEAGVLAPPLVESEDLPATTWQALTDEGHFGATEGELARLVVSDLAAELSDAAHQLVPTQSRRGDVLVESAWTIVHQAQALLTAVVIAAQTRATPWSEIDTVIGGQEGYDECARRPTEARYAQALAEWHRGIDRPYHLYGGRIHAQLPHAALHPRQTARRLDAWVLARRQPRDYDGGGDTPVSAHTVDATGNDHTSWLISTVLGVSSRTMYGLREPGPVATRVHAERKVITLAAAAKPGDTKAAETLAAGRAELDAMRARNVEASA
ncbi:hypothetical protein BBK14_01715 [Parafrankia soli]|uniref:Uncharacterized protein n=1 Tax=Parafrankia soli TaxID=2599596 RepID=A0A1S1RLC9_9ACTN|nr:hypothetical protein [Parafrankia soli]OHV46591.1 hypothetical protein BBK14_01715 [Parafrankia soli]